MKKTLISLFAITLILTGCSNVEEQTEEQVSNQNSPEQEAINNPGNEPMEEEIVTEQDDQMPSYVQAYMIDSMTSQVGWKGSKITGTDHNGNIAITQGSLKVDENLMITGGDFTINMDSISDADGSESLVSHLKSSDFFDTTNFPTAELTITEIQPDGALTEETKTFKITADLTIKDKTNSITFNATANKKDGNRMVANATFKIDRTKWGIVYGSGNFFKELGDNVINDEIEFTINLEAALSR